MEDHKGSGTADVSRYLSVGLTLTVATLLFLWLGTLADRWLGTRPAFTLVGAFVGAAAGFYHMIHHLIVVPKRRAEAAQRQAKERDGGVGRP